MQARRDHVGKISIHKPIEATSAKRPYASLHKRIVLKCRHARVTSADRLYTGSHKRITFADKPKTLRAASVNRFCPRLTTREESAQI